MAIALTGLAASVAVALFLSGQTRVAFAGMLTLDDWAIFFNGAVRARPASSRC